MQPSTPSLKRHGDAGSRARYLARRPRSFSITVACSGTGRDDDTGAASPTVTVDPEPVSEVTVAADQAATLQFSDQVTVIVPPSAVSPTP